jgi:hypothetical protein|tara:strand:- start:656 stop:832 length:177 start_codon:yes stop_codon:yes gene_type:complete
MNIILVVVLLGVGITIGMYVVSQIAVHIDTNTNNKELLDNLRKMDKQDLMDKRIDDDK